MGNTPSWPSVVLWHTVNRRHGHRGDHRLHFKTFYILLIHVTMLAKPQCPLFCCRTLLNIISHIQPRRQLLPDICHGSLDVCLCMHQMAGPSMSVEHMWRCHGTDSKRSARVQRFGRRGSALTHMQHARVEKGTDRNQPGMDRMDQTSHLGWVHAPHESPVGSQARLSFLL
jgi:hypothetical protein